MGTRDPSSRLRRPERGSEYSPSPRAGVKNALHPGILCAVMMWFLGAEVPQMCLCHSVCSLHCMGRMLIKINCCAALSFILLIMYRASYFDLE